MIMRNKYTRNIKHEKLFEFIIKALIIINLNEVLIIFDKYKWVKIVFIFIIK